jgi:hypothetical protein
MQKRRKSTAPRSSSGIQNTLQQFVAMSEYCLRGHTYLSVYPHELTAREREAKAAGGPYFYIVRLRSVNSDAMDVDDKNIAADEEGDLWAIVSQPHCRIIYLDSRTHVENWADTMRTREGLTLGLDVSDTWQVLFLEARPKVHNAPALADVLLALLYWGTTPEGILEFLDYIRNEPEGDGSYRPTFDQPLSFLRVESIGNGYYRSIMRTLVAALADQLFAYPENSLPDVYVFSANAIISRLQLPRIPADDLFMPLYGYQISDDDEDWSTTLDEIIHRRALQQRDHKAFMEKPPQNALQSPFATLPMDIMQSQIVQYLDNADAAAMQLTSAKYAGKLPRPDELLVNSIPNIVATVTVDGKWNAQDVEQVALILSRSQSIYFSSHVHVNTSRVSLRTSSCHLLEAAMDLLARQDKNHRELFLHFDFDQTPHLELGHEILQRVLLKALSTFTNVKYLRIDSHLRTTSQTSGKMGYNVAPKFVENLKRIIHNNKTIQSLYLYANVQNISVLCDIFLQRETPLRILELISSIGSYGVNDADASAVGKLIAENSESLRTLRIDWRTPFREQDREAISTAMLSCKQLEVLRILRSTYIPLKTQTQMIAQNAGSLQSLSVVLNNQDAKDKDDDMVPELVALAKSMGDCRKLRILKIKSKMRDAQGRAMDVSVLGQDALVNSIVSLPNLKVLSILPYQALGLRSIVRILNHAARQAMSDIPARIRYAIGEVPALVVYRAAIRAQTEFIRVGRLADIDLQRDDDMETFYRDKIFSAVIKQYSDIHERIRWRDDYH